ncbi:MAG: chromate transporter [Anaerolineales bacterium]|nr:chromate transporter [Anaerolineales bacterium]NUQ84098.1 chromate transporter [Anaerolineales bacterium]
MPPALEVFASFLKLGFTAFGGPAAHIGMFRDEFVHRRKWLTDEAFLDLLGATNLIPGPNSTEMAIHIGFLRAGWAGLIAGGLAFTLPAMLIVLVFAWLYVEYGSTPQASWLLYGVKPVMIAIILQALWELGRKAIKGKLTLAIGIVCIVLYFLGVNEVLLLFAGGLTLMLIQNWTRLREAKPSILLPLLPALTAAPVSFSLSTLFLTFLKIGAILYGSGYVLVAFLRADFVERLGWLTEQQLIDAIAIGQITPGPLFTSATFIGYLLGGVPAALIATLGIFLPSYIFVAMSNPIISKLRASAWAGSLLDGVIVASLGLMAAVTFQLGLASLIDLPTIVIFGLSAILLFRYRVNTTWLIVGGALIGFITSTLN